MSRELDIDEHSKQQVKKPSKFWLITETTRAIIELGLYLPYKTFRNYDEQGDGHPVMVLPGFMATDVSTKPLRKFLSKLGYESFGWGLGRNYANEDYLDALLDRVDQIYLENRTKVSLIGWSLGGIYARQIAKTNPHLIRQVITLGSPFSGITESNHAAWLHKIITDGKGTEVLDPDLIADIPKPAPVPTTAIYSKQDGVVPWEFCMEKDETNTHQNVQVRGSHLGLGINPSVLQIIEDRLQYSEENWVPFRPDNIVEDVLLYPSI